VLAEMSLGRQEDTIDRSDGEGKRFLLERIVVVGGGIAALRAGCGRGPTRDERQSRGLADGAEHSQQRGPFRSHVADVLPRGTTVTLTQSNSVVSAKSCTIAASSSHTE
jgi:hypothetical protein